VVRIALVASTRDVALSVGQLLADRLSLIIRYSTIAEALAADSPDVILLERRFLDKTLNPLFHVRRRWPHVALAIVGARGEHDVATLIDAGADDALIITASDYSPRLHALTRRARALNSGARIALGDIVFDRESRRVWCSGKEIHLTPKEQALLDCFFWHSPRVVDLATLASFAWRGSTHGSRKRLVRVYLGYLRKKLSGSQNVRIATVRGVGYQMMVKE
jgi:DNA-binding response OmpR family regulator